MKNIPVALLIIVILIIIGGLVVSGLERRQTFQVTNFEECAGANGGLVMESYPRQCRYGDETFAEYIGSEPEKADLIRLNFPRPSQTVSSPLVISGEARGNWFFEASFPVVLTNWDGLIIGEGIATAKNDWMTEEFVPFEATITYDFDEGSYSNRGTLILRKDNPSDLPENDDVLEVPVVIE